MNRIQVRRQTKPRFWILVFKWCNVSWPPVTNQHDRTKFAVCLFVEYWEFVLVRLACFCPMLNGEDSKNIRRYPMILVFVSNMSTWLGCTSPRGNVRYQCVCVDMVYEASLWAACDVETESDTQIIMLKLNISKNSNRTFFPPVFNC